MRKIYFILSLLFLSFFVSAVRAQVSTYVFTPTTGTYTSLTGATTSTATGDDGTQNVALGFNFTFGGAVYTNAVISTNGAIKLATSAATGFATSWTNNLSNAYGAAIIAPLWDDNNASGGSVVYLLSGTAPNRTFSVEWQNIHMGGTGSTSTPTGTFKVILTETSNSIRVEYGTINSPTASTIGIGLNDLTSFLSVTPGSPATASSTTANNNITSNTGLASGTVYLFNIPPPCVAGSLNGGTTIASVASACPSANFDLSVTAASFGTGLTFQWESSPDGVTWSDMPSATGAALTTSQTTTTYYRRKMTCSGTDAWSTPVQVTMNGFLNCYCNNNLTTFVNGVDIVTNVVVTNASGATLTQASTSNGTTNYTQYNNTPLDLAQSTSNNLAITFGTDGTQWSAAWIDFNQNGIFEASENITLASAAAGGSATVNYAFVVPGGATLGLTRLRVRGGSDGAYTAAGACATTNFGETEDYLVNIVPAPPCVAPTGLAISAITTTTATISWTAASPAPGAGYEWEIRTSGTGGSGPTGLVASGTTASNTANVTGLSATTTYTLYVRSVCTAGTLYSTWTASSAFTTPCNPTNVTYIQDFESAAAPALPTCTSGETISGNPWTVVINPGSGFTSQTLRYAYNSSAAANSWFYTQGINLTAGQSYRLSYRYGNNSTFFAENLKVAYGTNPAAASMTTQLADHLNIVSNAAQSNQLDFIAPSTGVFYIGFQSHSTADQFYLFLDDIKLKLTPTCDEPTNVSANAISPTSANVYFTSPGNAFIVEYGPVGFTPGVDNNPGVGGTLQLGTSSPITISPLTPSTTYDVYVRRVCIPGVDFSENVKAAFTTLCPAVNVPYLQDFETSTPPSGFPTCTNMEDVNGNSGPDANATGGRWVTFQGASNQVYVSPTKSIRYLYDAANSSRPADDWFYIQGLNLTGGTSYRLKFYYKGSDGPIWTEKLEVKYGTQAYSGAMTNLLYTNNDIETALANPFDSAIVDFTPAATGVYYIGFHAISLADQAFLYMDNISVKVTPLVDVGPSTATIPTCPATAAGALKAVIRNYNITPQNFATYPVTVTATISGAASGTLTATINSGTLAPGATTTVDLPAFNFASGSYNVTITTSSPSDPETGNDTYTTSFYVNPSPTVATITPAAPAICAGASVQLNTQFTTPPPAPVTMPAVPSGVISVTVPDASAVGATHSLSVSGVPATASVLGISVNMNMTHTWIADMSIALKAPNGKILNLFNRRGAAAQQNITNMTISSTASTPIPATGAPFTGTWAADAAMNVGPTGLESNATGFSDLYSQGNGTWTLVMRDHASGDIGILTSWSITITYGTVYPNVTWAPVAGLFTNAALTTPYTGGSAYSVYAQPNATTTYTATSTNPLTGCTSSNTVTITVNANPVVTLNPLPARICISDELVSLSANPTGGIWSGIGVSGSSFVPPNTAVGTYTLSYTYTNALGCSTTKTASARVEECPERMILLRDNSMVLFPNPNSGQFSIRMTTTLYNRLSMRVYNSAGSLVHTREITGLVWGRVVPFNLNYLPAGTYMVQFSYAGGVRTEEKTFKVIVGH